MHKLIKNKNFTNGMRLFLLAVSVIIAYKVINSFGSFVGEIQGFFAFFSALLFPFVVGFSIAYILNPAVDKIEKSVFLKSKLKFVKKHRKGLALFAVYVLVAFVIFIFVNFVVPEIIHNIVDLVKQVPSYLNQLMEYKDVLKNDENMELLYTIFLSVEDSVNQFMSGYNAEQIAYTITSVAKGIMGTASTLLNIVLGFIISIYFILEKKPFIKGIKRLMRTFMKRENVDRSIEFGNSANKIFSGFIIGKMIDSLIIAILFFIGAAILGLKNTFLLTLIIGITNMIPYFGPFIGGVPAVILTFFESPITALWLGIFIFILQQFDGMILGPKILGNSIKLSPFWIIFAILIGGGLFGVAGMFLGAPVLAIIKFLVDRRIGTRLKNKLKKEQRTKLLAKQKE